MAGADPIRCRDGCGASVATVAEAEAQTWTFLVIAKGWRCLTCAQELDAVNRRYAEQEQNGSQ